MQRLCFIYKDCSISFICLFDIPQWNSKDTTKTFTYVKYLCILLNIDADDHKRAQLYEKYEMTSAFHCQLPTFMKIYSIISGLQCLLLWTDMKEHVLDVINFLIETNYYQIIWCKIKFDKSRRKLTFRKFQAW